MDEVQFDDVGFGTHPAHVAHDAFHPTQGPRRRIRLAVVVVVVDGRLDEQQVHRAAGQHVRAPAGMRAAPSRATECRRR